MTSAVQQIICENNEGARLLRQSHYDSAVKSFTSVLQRLNPLAVIVEEKYAAHYNTRHRNDHDSAIANANASNCPFTISFNHTKPTTDDDTYDENDSSRIAHHMHTPSSPSSISSPVDASSLSSTSTSTTHEIPQQQQRQQQRQQRKLKHFVFRDPVIIPPQSRALLSAATTATATATATATNSNIEDLPSSSIYSPALFSKFLMIVMYNLALTFHLQALSLVASTSSSTSTVSSSNHHRHVKKLFVRSRKLYELAFELHLETDVDPLFTLALTNNLGLIYRTVNERKKCLICFHNMFSTMMYLMDSHHHSQTNSQSYEPTSSSSLQSSIKNWDGLLSNAMDILFKHTYEVVAAAA